MSAPFEPNKKQLEMREHAQKNDYKNRVGVHPLPLFDTVSLESFYPGTQQVFEHEDRLGIPPPAFMLPLRKICVICDLPSRDVICESCYDVESRFIKDHPYCLRCSEFVDLLANGGCAQCGAPPFELE